MKTETTNPVYETVALPLSYAGKGQNPAEEGKNSPSGPHLPHTQTASGSPSTATNGGPSSGSAEPHKLDACSVEDLRAPRARRPPGMSKWQWRKFRVGLPASIPMPLDERLARMSVSDSLTGCRLLTSRLCRSGYGNILVGNKYVVAHRVAYELAKGPIPEGLQIDHLCRVRRCINPDHLEAVTPSENMRRSSAADAARKRASTKTHCYAGHPYTPENVVAVGRSGRRTCRTCLNARKREYYERNREECIARSQRYRKATSNTATASTSLARRYRMGVANG